MHKAGSREESAGGARVVVEGRRRAHVVDGAGGLVMGAVARWGDLQVGGGGGPPLQPLAP
jgi:hypothetical protein